MPHRSIQNHWLAFEDLCDDIYFVISEEDPNAFAYCCRIAADGDQLPVAACAH